MPFAMVFFLAATLDSAVLASGDRRVMVVAYGLRDNPSFLMGQNLSYLSCSVIYQASVF